MLTVAAGQRGQALVAVMVVMIVLFALAGAVAIGASTLLTSHGNSDATNDDFQVRSAVNDATAQIAGLPSRCGAPPPLPSPSPTPSPSPMPSPLNLSLPGAAPTQAFCARQDWVDPNQVSRHRPTGSCGTLSLGQPGGRLAVLFDTRVTAGGWAYLDTDQTLAGCGAPLPTPSPGPLACRRSFGPGAPVVQVALTCDFAAGQAAYLHLNVSGAGPKQVFSARVDPPGHADAVGVLTLVAAGTGVAKPDFEESLFYVSNDGGTQRLLYEAPLP